MQPNSLLQPGRINPANGAAAAEIEIQVATARRYPRSVDAALNRILTVATLDEDTAADCFYTLRRGSGAGAQIIEGISIRLAEIIASAWGNLRVQAEIVANDGRAITARAYCHDLETNYAVAIHVQRAILDRYGHPYSPDMQVVTGNAAMAIAFRNAVLKVIPKAVTARAVEQIRAVAERRVRNLDQTRLAMLDYFAGIGVDAPRLFGYLGVDTIDAIDAAAVVELRGLANALAEGTATLESLFPPPTETESTSAQARRLLGKASAARAAARAATHAPAPKAPGAETDSTSTNTSTNTNTNTNL